MITKDNNVVLKNDLIRFFTDISMTNKDIFDKEYKDIETPILKEIDQPMFINSIYTYARPKKGQSGGYGSGKQQYNPDTLVQIYRDTDGSKKLNVMEKPNYTFYVTKDEHTPSINLDSIELDKVKPITVEYNKVTDAMASIVNRSDEYYNLRKQRGPEAFEAKREFQTSLQCDTRFFSSDIQVEDYYKNLFQERYGQKFIGYHKSYMDIEVDTRFTNGEFPDPEKAEAPVNAISYLDDITQTMYVLIVNNSNYKGQDQVINDPEGFFTRFKQKILLIQDEMNRTHFNKTGKSNGNALIVNYDIKFDFRVFPTETDLLIGYANLINILEPDFINVWNMKFDFLTIVNRMKHLGLDPEEILSSKHFPESLQMVKWKEDRNPRVSKPQLLFHWATVGNSSQYLDAMSVYANLRKSRGVKPSYALDRISRDEINIGKLDHSDTPSFADFPYEDFILFLEYNIFDVLLLHALENKNLDIEQLQMLSNNTRLSQATKITAIIKNKLTKFYKDKDMIIGNNVNVINSPPTDKYPGAIVSNPDNNGYVGIKMLDRPTNSHFEHCNDLDLEAMYPNIKTWSNIYKNTLHGRFKVHDDSLERQGYDVYRFMDNLQTRDFVRLGMDVFGCPGPEYYLEGIEIAVRKWQQEKRCA